MYAMMTCANLMFVVQDLLIDSVVFLGALLCGVLGGGAGALVGATFGAPELILAGAVIGLWTGLMAGGSAAGILSSGTKTILVLWAEDPEPLRRMEPTIHQEFETRIMGKLTE